MREDQDQDAAQEARESDPIKLNVFGENQSALYQAVSKADTSSLRASLGEKETSCLNCRVNNQTFFTFMKY